MYNILMVKALSLHNTHIFGDKLFHSQVISDKLLVELKITWYRGKSIAHVIIL